MSSVSAQLRAVSNSAPKNPVTLWNLLKRAAEPMPEAFRLGIQT
jgi:hypothetical protein